MRAGTDSHGGLAILYRSAMSGVQRDMIFAYAAKPGAALRIVDLEPWKLSACPMSTAAIASAGDGLLIAWQGEQGLHWTTAKRGKPGKPVPFGARGAKHPCLAQGTDGTIAVVRTEGTGWNKGGSLHWQLYDAKGTALGDPGRHDGVPVWSIPTVVADTPGHFSVWY